LLERVVPQAFSGEATFTVTAARVTWVLVSPLAMMGDVSESPTVEE
jgi:hypothetical protein